MIFNLINPSDRPLANDPPPYDGHYVEVGDPVDATTISSSPFATFASEDGSTYLGRFQQGQEIPLVLQCTDAEGSPDDPASIPQLSIFIDRGGSSEYIITAAGFSGGCAVLNGAWEFSFLELTDGDPPGIRYQAIKDGMISYLGRFPDLSSSLLTMDIETRTAGYMSDADYGDDILLIADDVGACSNNAPASLLAVRSGLQIIETVDMPADLRDVVVGLFRKPLFLGAAYSEAGRYLVLFKWLDSNNVPHVKTASFHILPNGSSDGSIIAMRYTSRPDANYLIWQCDSGRIIRKPNPR